MPDDLHYAREQLGRAVYYLAIGAGDVRERLRLAAPELTHVRVEALPDGIREDFESLLADLTRKKPQRWQDGALEATLFRMRRTTGVAVAKRIWELLYRVETELEPVLASDQRLFGLARTEL